MHNIKYSLIIEIIKNISKISYFCKPNQNHKTITMQKIKRQIFYFLEYIKKAIFIEDVV